MRSTNPHETADFDVEPDEPTSTRSTTTRQVDRDRRVLIGGKRHLLGAIGASHPRTLEGNPAPTERDPASSSLPTVPRGVLP